MPRKRAAQRRVARHSVPAARSSHFTGMFFILLNVVLWGVAPVLIKSAFTDVSPQVFLYYRFLIVVALSTPYLFLMRKRYATIKTPKQLATVLFIGLLSNPLSLLALFIGLQYTTTASAAIISSTAPLCIVIASAIFLREKITRHEIVGALIATVGTLLIVLETPVQLSAPHPLLGNLLVIVNNILWTVAILWMKKLSTTHEPFLFGYTGWLTGAIVMGAISLFTHPAFVLQPLVLLQLPDALWPILYMSVFGSLVAFTAYQIAQKYLPASEVGVITYLEPIFTIPLSVFWLHEQLGMFFALGSAVIILGVCLAEFHSSSRLRRTLARFGRK